MAGTASGPKSYSQSRMRPEPILPESNPYTLKRTLNLKVPMWLCFQAALMGWCLRLFGLLGLGVKVDWSKAQTGGCQN